MKNSIGKKALYKVLFLLYLLFLSGCGDMNSNIIDEFDETLLKNIPPGDAKGYQYTGCYEISSSFYTCINGGCIIGCDSDSFVSSVGYDYFEQADGVLKYVTISKNIYRVNKYGSINQDGTFFLGGSCSHYAGYYYSYSVCSRYDGKFLDHNIAEGVSKSRTKGTYTSTPVDCTEVVNEKWKRTDKSKCMQE